MKKPRIKLGPGNFVLIAIDTHLPGDANWEGESLREEEERYRLEEEYRAALDGKKVDR